MTQCWFVLKQLKSSHRTHDPLSPLTSCRTTTFFPLLGKLAIDRNVGMAVWFTTVEDTQSNEIDTKTFFFYLSCDLFAAVWRLREFWCAQKCSRSSIGRRLIKRDSHKCGLNNCHRLDVQASERRHFSNISITILVQSAHDNEW